MGKADLGLHRSGSCVKCKTRMGGEVDEKLDGSLSRTNSGSSRPGEICRAGGGLTLQSGALWPNRDQKASPMTLGDSSSSLNQAVRLASGEAALPTQLYSPAK